MKNKNNNFIAFGAGAFFLAALIALASNIGSDAREPITYSASALTAEEIRFDFGAISMANGNVSHNFTLKNEGPESVIIEKVYTSCMCTTALITDSSGGKYGEFGMPGHANSKTNVEVLPGETVTVEAIFDPAAHGPSGVGLAQRSIYLETNSVASPKLELFFQAMVSR